MQHVKAMILVIPVAVWKHFMIVGSYYLPWDKPGFPESIWNHMFIQKLC